MGYYTSYKLKVSQPDGEPLDEGGRGLVYQALKEKAEDLYGLDLQKGPYDEYDGSDPCKWYTNEKDMQKLSQLFPDVLFTLSGEGEEAGDIWAKYFLDGKMQEAKAEIIVAPFDPSKLR